MVGVKTEGAQGEEVQGGAVWGHRAALTGLEAAAQESTSRPATRWMFSRSSPKSGR